MAQVFNIIYYKFQIFKIFLEMINKTIEKECDSVLPGVVTSIVDKQQLNSTQW